MTSQDNIARLRKGITVAILAAAMPATVLAQWWGPVGGPMGGHPGFSGLPRAPSVGEFMSNPWGGMPRPRGYGQRKTVSRGTSVVGPRTVLPAARVVRPLTVVPVARVVTPIRVLPVAQVIRPTVVVPSAAEASAK